MADNGDGAVHEAPAPDGQYQYPFAAAPDIIRSHQKDAYFQAVLFEQLATILRSLKGARFLHTFTTEARAASDIAYLGLTTLVGNRTLGEEYCDVVQVEGDTGRLPAVTRRGGYILATIILPYALNRILPRLRQRIRAVLEASVSRQRGKGDKSGQSRGAVLQSYMLDNLDTITSTAPVYALSLATFYFSGAYYHLAKRLFNLRYIFTRNPAPSEQRAGYEVLGVLLILQISVQAYLHLHQTLSLGPARDTPPPQLANPESLAGTSALLPGEVEVSLDPTAYTSNNTLLFTSDAAADPSAPQRRLAHTTHTPHLSSPRHDLSDRTSMKWLSGRQSRRCTLCLEPMRDPSATTCGHLFCWTCICDWCREKPECPLCRQACLVQHVLPLRE